MTDILAIDKKPDTVYAVPLWVRDEQIRVNSARIKQRVKPGPKRDDPIAVVGYGPSLRDTWQQIKDFKYVISCSGATKFLLEHGIVSNWHLDVDPRAHKAEMIQPHKDTEYLLASCVSPKMLDLLEGHNVKLWHVYSRDGESEQVLPPGEWQITGGCDVGMRCMTIARLLGFTEQHIFGLDGCEGGSGKHAGFHPNQPKDHSVTVYKGKEYRTTPAMLASAQQVFHEINQMPDLKVHFYGKGLIQAMAADFKREKPKAMELALLKPALISDDYRQQNVQLHASNVAYGVGGAKHADTVKGLVEKLGTHSVLDYGCGKGYLAKNLDFPIWEYDPAIPGKDTTPKPADIVICSDVLEHIEPDRLDFVLHDLRRCVRKVGLFVIHLGPASKTLPDGRNTHLIQKDAVWWRNKLSQFFSIGKTWKKKQIELYVVAGVK